MGVRGGRAGAAVLAGLVLAGCSVSGPAGAPVGGEQVGGSPAALSLTVTSILTQIDTDGPYSASDVAAVAAADLGIAGSELTETVLAEDGTALCFGVRRSAATSARVVTVVVGSGAVGRVERAPCSQALPVASPVLAYDALIRKDLERVRSALASEGVGSDVVATATGVRVGARDIELSEGVSLVDADTAFGRVCVTLGEEGRYWRGVDSLLGDRVPRPGAACTTATPALPLGLVVGADSLDVAPVDAVDTASGGLDEPLRADLTTVGRAVLDAAQASDEAVLAASMSRLAAYLGSAREAGTFGSLTTSEQTATWAVDGPEGALYLPDNLRWDAFARSAEGWCVTLLWNDRTSTASGGERPPSC